MGEIGGNDYNDAFFQQRPMQEVQTFVPLVVDKIINALKVSEFSISIHMKARLN
jgi:hypothetical protein